MRHRLACLETVAIAAPGSSDRRSPDAAAPTAASTERPAPETIDERASRVTAILFSLRCFAHRISQEANFGELA
jgi:hypothetical protein